MELYTSILYALESLFYSCLYSIVWRTWYRKRWSFGNKRVKSAFLIKLYTMLLNSARKNKIFVIIFYILKNLKLIMLFNFHSCWNRWKQMNFNKSLNCIWSNIVKILFYRINYLCTYIFLFKTMIIILNLK